MNKKETERAYKKLILSGNVLEACRCLESLIPKKLYNYSSFNKHWHSKIIEGKLFLNTPFNFNDPYDCLLKGGKEFWKNIYCELNSNIARSEIDSTDETSCVNINGKMKTFDEFIAEGNKELKSKYGIACFSENKNSMLMWSHYADMHKGYVIEIDTQKLLEDLQNKTFFNPLFKVVYDNKRIDIQDVYDSNNNISFLLCKSLDWKYEKEWRFISTPNKFVDISCYISAIYLGSRFDFNGNLIEATTIKNHCENNGIDLYKMELADDKYELRQRKVNEI